MHRKNIVYKTASNTRGFHYSREGEVSNVVTTNTEGILHNKILSIVVQILTLPPSGGMK